MQLILPHDGQFQEPSPPIRFKFEAKSRVRYPIVPEKRGARLYWFLRKQVNGRLFNLYVSKQGKLSQELLENAAVHVEAQA